jgi:hypothetical protein
MGNEEGQRVGERLGHGRPVEEKIGFLGQWGGGGDSTECHKKRIGELFSFSITFMNCKLF